MKKLIDGGDGGNSATRQSHHNNLGQMVNYCEELSQCR